MSVTGCQQQKDYYSLRSFLSKCEISSSKAHTQFSTSCWVRRGGGGPLWPCLLPDSEAKVLYVRASFAGKIGFPTWKREEKNKKWRPCLIGQVLLGWHPLHWTCLINWRFSSLEKFFAVKVADLLYTSIDTTRLVLDTSTVSLALLLIKAAQAVVAKVRRAACGTWRRSLWCRHGLDSYVS